MTETHSAMMTLLS